LWSQANYWYDECKMNLLWLVKPEVDDLVLAQWVGDEVSRSIDVLLSKDIRALLTGPPVEFMRDFVRIDDGIRLTAQWPSGYQKVMWARAKEANTRLCAGLGPNVYKFDFKTRRKFG
jgi:hypothetical protein